MQFCCICVSQVLYFFESSANVTIRILQANPQVGPCSQLWILYNLVVFSRFDIRWHLQVWLSSVPQLSLCGSILVVSVIQDLSRYSKEGSLGKAILQTVRNAVSFSLWYHLPSFPFEAYGKQWISLIIASLRGVASGTLYYVSLLLECPV